MLLLRRKRKITLKVLRPEFHAALDMFAKVSRTVDEAGYHPPILVGGAAAELYSGSEISTGDFDLVIARQDALEQALLEHGFQKPPAPGHSFPGWVHPMLGLAFEIVGSSLLDGHADHDRVQIFSVSGNDEFAVIAPEDLIADRMGQYASGTAKEMLEQAKTLFALSKGLDLTYMERRIREETSDEYGISDLQA